MIIIRSIYISLYVFFFKIGEGQWPADFNADAHKGVAGISLIEGFYLLSPIVYFEGRNDYLNKWILVSSFLAIFIFNAYYLLGQGNGIRFEGEFQKFSKSKKFLSYSFAFGIVIFCMIGFYLSVKEHHRAMRSI